MKQVELVRVIEIHERAWRSGLDPDSLEAVIFRIEVFKECDASGQFFVRVWAYDTFDIIPTFTASPTEPATEYIITDAVDKFFSDISLRGRSVEDILRNIVSRIEELTVVDPYRQ